MKNSIRPFLVFVIIFIVLSYFIIGGLALALKFAGVRATQKPPDELLFLAVSLTLLIYTMFTSLQITAAKEYRNNVSAFLSKKTPIILLFLTSAIWIIFIILISQDQHLMIVTVTDFHGASMGESYIQPAFIPLFLLFLHIPVTATSFLGLLVGKKRMSGYIYLFNFVAGLLWLIYYFSICKTEVYRW